jgi:hypothetical protein
VKRMTDVVTSEAANEGKAVSNGTGPRRTSR